MTGGLGRDVSHVNGRRTGSAELADTLRRGLADPEVKKRRKGKDGRTQAPDPEGLWTKTVKDQRREHEERRRLAREDHHARDRVPLGEAASRWQGALHADVSLAV